MLLSSSVLVSPATVNREHGERVVGAEYMCNQGTPNGTKISGGDYYYKMSVYSTCITKAFSYRYRKLCLLVYPFRLCIRGRHPLFTLVGACIQAKMLQPGLTAAPPLTGMNLTVLGARDLPFRRPATPQRKEGCVLTVQKYPIPYAYTSINR